MVDIVGGLTDAYDAAAGTADHLAGSTDEAVSRSFDGTEGGGLYDGTAGLLDHLAGSTDEATARQFDDTPGGGLLEGAGEAAENVGSAATEGVAWAASGYTGALTDVGQSVLGEWWMLFVALAAIAFIFREPIADALGLYATGGASAAAGGVSS